MSKADDINAGLIIRTLCSGDYPAAKEIVRRSFDDHLQQNPGVMEEYENEPWYDPEHLLVAETEGRVVSQMGVRTGTLWIDGSEYPAGLVGTVCTLPEFRGSGIGAEMMRGAFAWMDTRGLALSYLHTSEARHGFYGRLGYRLSSYFSARTIIEVGELEPPSEDAAICRATPRDAGVLNQLYEAHYGMGSGAWSRTEPFWVRRLEGKPKLWFTGEPEFWIMEKREPFAYIALVAGAPARIVEFACPDLNLPAAGRLLSHTIRRLGVREVEITIGKRDPLWPVLKDYRTTDRTSRGNVLIRVQDRRKFLNLAGKLLRERADRLDLSFEIRLTDTGETLSEHRSGATIMLYLSLHELGALIYSGGRIHVLLAAGVVILEGGKVEDLIELLPENYPSRCALDGY